MGNITEPKQDKVTLNGSLVFPSSLHSFPSFHSGDTGETVGVSVSVASLVLLCPGDSMSEAGLSF